MSILRRRHCEVVLALTRSLPLRFSAHPLPFASLGEGLGTVILRRRHCDAAMVKLVVCGQEAAEAISRSVRITIVRRSIADILSLTRSLPLRFSAHPLPSASLGEGLGCGNVRLEVAIGRWGDGANIRGHPAPSSLRCGYVQTGGLRTGSRRSNLKICSCHPDTPTPF